MTATSSETSDTASSTTAPALNGINRVELEICTKQLESPSTTSESTMEDKRPIEVLVKLAKQEKFDQLSNEEIIDLMQASQVSVHKLEAILGKVNASRCVDIRRQYYIRELELLDKQQSNININYAKTRSQHLSTSPKDIVIVEDNVQNRADALKRPQTTEFDYARVNGACCENVVGCVRLPVGVAGPLVLDNDKTFVPMATTEGCLVASTNRGMLALARCGGVFSRVRKNCMTRAPIVEFVDHDMKDALDNVDRALEWLHDETNKEKIKAAFNSTSRHTKLIDYTTHPSGRTIHIRFAAQTGDAMGMNMCSKGAEMALKEMQRVFPTMDILTLSGNMCTDKKPSGINWVLGRGKSIECSASLSAEVVEKVLKVTIDRLYEVWLEKVMIGSAMAGSVGGFNAHAANIVEAIFIATGQDAAQVVSSSNCIMKLKKRPNGSLEVHCYMPSIECGTVGGGTVLADQSSYLQLMGIKGSSADRIGEMVDDVDSDSNACKLARIICGTVMAAELSLLASLSEGTLVKSHMTHNRLAQPCNVV